MARTFEVGEEVLHRTDNSQKMIVTAVNGSKVTCEWRAAGQTRREEFDAITLEPYRIKPETNWQSFDADVEGDGDFMTA